MAEDGEGEPLAPGRRGAKPLELAKADTYSSGGILGLNEDIGSDEMLDKFGKNGAAELGVGLPLNPIARPESGARTERGEVTLLGLSRADRLKGGPFVDRKRVEHKEPINGFLLIKLFTF